MCEKAVILQYYDDTVIGGGKEIKNNLLSMHTHTPTASRKLLELEEKALVLCPVRHQEEFC